MNLLKFSKSILSLVHKCKKNGIDPKTIKVVINHGLGESVGNIDSVDITMNIPYDEIPYDVHGLDPVKPGDNVVFINGGN